MTNRVIVGGFEVVSLPQFGLTDIVAKIDTGAYSGAIHCTEIEEQVNAAGTTELRFTMDGRHYAITEFVRKKVRSATGHQIGRYVVMTKIIVQGREYDVSIGISDRSSLTFPVLIGRKFLRQQNMIVDVTRNVAHDPEGAQ